MLRKPSNLEIFEVQTVTPASVGLRASDASTLWVDRALVGPTRHDLMQLAFRAPRPAVSPDAIEPMSVRAAVVCDESGQCVVTDIVHVTLGARGLSEA